MVIADHLFCLRTEKSRGAGIFIANIYLGKQSRKEAMDMSRRDVNELISRFPEKWYPFEEIARRLEVPLEVFVEWRNSFEVPLFLVNGVKYMIRDNITWGIRSENIPHLGETEH